MGTGLSAPSAQLLGRCAQGRRTLGALGCLARAHEGEMALGRAGGKEGKKGAGVGRRMGQGRRGGLISISPFLNENTTKTIFSNQENMFRHAIQHTNISEFPKFYSFLKY
jgi:hypothetical protein